MPYPYDPVDLNEKAQVDHVEAPKLTRAELAPFVGVIVFFCALVIFVLIVGDPKLKCGERKPEVMPDWAYRKTQKDCK